MAVIEKGLITEFYDQYRRNQDRSRDIEAGLVKAVDRSSWVEKLAEKSEFLRNTYAYNEERLGKLIYPFVREGRKLDMETADEFFENIYTMTQDAENDSLLTTEMLIKLQSFYKRKHWSVICNTKRARDITTSRRSKHAIWNPPASDAGTSPSVC